MKKLTATLLAAILGVSMLASCGQKQEEANAPAGEEQKATDTSLEDIKAKGYFLVGLDATFAPMGFTDEAGEIVGFDIDLAKKVAEKMELDVKFQPIDWNSKSMELEAGNIDVIWNGFSITDERKKEVLFTDPYLSTSQAIIVTTDSPIKTKADLAGKIIALQDGSTSESALKADEETFATIGEENLSRFKENPEVLMEIETGRADAAVIDEVFVRYHLTSEGLLDKFVVLEESFDKEDYGVGGRLEDVSFMTALNDAIKACVEDGSASECAIKWFGEDLYKTAE